MFISALFIIKWEKNKCLSDFCVFVHVYEVEYYPVITNDTLSLLIKNVNLRNQHHKSFTVL